MYSLSTESVEYQHILPKNMFSPKSAFRRSSREPGGLMGEEFMPFLGRGCKCCGALAWRTQKISRPGSSVELSARVELAHAGVVEQMVASMRK